MGSFGTIEREETVARRNSKDEACDCCYVDQHHQQKSAEEYVAIVGGKLHIPGNTSDAHRQHHSPGSHK